MKSKLMLASMILLASLSASAQKIYTGAISFPNGNSYGNVITDVDNSDPLNESETANGKKYLNNAVSMAFGKPATVYFNRNSSQDRKVSTIFVQKLSDAKENPYLKNLPASKGDLVVYSILDGGKRDNIFLVLDVCILNTKEKTVYDVRNKVLRPYKM